LVLVLIAGANTTSVDTLVRSLPDLEGTLPPNSMYAGYLNVTGRFYYYVFVRAQEQPDTAPFLFWTNGGPGCSSVGEGLWMEHGPYKVSNKRAGIERNPFSWNRLANVLYLEHPVGVGFSYAEDNDYKHLGDDREADDLYHALMAFTERYPEFGPSEERPLYLTGESYGGEYVPHLAHRIIFGKESALLSATLRGMAVANPVFNCEGDKSGKAATLQYQMYYHHGLMSYEQFNKWGLHSCDQGSHALSAECQNLLSEAEDAIGTVNQQLLKRTRLKQSWRRAAALEAGDEQLTEANFDPDHKYQSFCLGNNTLEFSILPNADTDASACHALGDPGRMATYLNRKDVQAALHIDSSKMAQPVWTDCAGDWIEYNVSSANVLTQYYTPIFAARSPSEFRVLVFSGDEDIGTVPAPLTQMCLAELRGSVQRITDWRPWTHNGITAGYFEVFDRYTYATVKGAGHTVPQYQPTTAFQLMNRWLSNSSLVN